jgi:translocation and assembly module TamA
MSQVAAGRRVAAALAAVALFSHSQQVKAQQAGALTDLQQPLDPSQPLPPLPELDPSAPLDPLPDLGVPWPDMDSEAQTAATPDPIIADAGAERSYTIVLEGLDEATSSALAARFNSLSVLEANRDDPANAAQLDRRARQDADLLAELLRASGYYDAAVATRVEGAQSGAARVVLETRPGPLYRFAEVSLPGLDAAGPERAALEQAFGVAAGAPVDAAAVTAGEAALRAELGGAASPSPMWARWT